MTLGCCSLRSCGSILTTVSTVGYSRAQGPEETCLTQGSASLLGNPSWPRSRSPSAVRVICSESDRVFGRQPGLLPELAEPATLSQPPALSHGRAELLSRRYIPERAARPCVRMTD